MDGAGLLWPDKQNTHVVATCSVTTFILTSHSFKELYKYYVVQYEFKEVLKGVSVVSVQTYASIIKPHLNVGKWINVSSLYVCKMRSQKKSFCKLTICQCYSDWAKLILSVRTWKLISLVHNNPARPWFIYFIYLMVSYTHCITFLVSSRLTVKVKQAFYSTEMFYSNFSCHGIKARRGCTSIVKKMIKFLNAQ